MNCSKNRNFIGSSFCHSERSEESGNHSIRFFAALRMTKGAFGKFLDISAIGVQKSFKILSSNIRKSHNSIHLFCDIKTIAPQS